MERLTNSGSILSHGKKVDPALRKGSALSTKRLQANSEKKELLSNSNRLQKCHREGAKGGRNEWANRFFFAVTESPYEKGISIGGWHS